MKKIYIAGKISGECDTPELKAKCYLKFHSYGLKYLYPPNGDIIPYTISGFSYSSYDADRISFTEAGKCFTHGFIINHELIYSGNGSWQKYMRNDITILLTCDEAHFLPDWEDSKGAKIEHQICVDLEIPIVYVKDENI